MPNLPDFRYWTIGRNTYYVPYYLKMTALTFGAAIGLIAPVVIVAAIAWALW